MLLLGFTCPVFAQEFKSEPFGREILTVGSGFNYLGLRLHRKAVCEGVVTAVTTGSMAVGIPAKAVSALGPDDFFLFEVETGTATGAVIPITAYDQVAQTITLNDDLSSDLQVGDRFTIRPSATLASVFGANNESGMGAASSAWSADQVWIPDGAGSFDRYFFYSANFSGPVNKWYHSNTNQEVDPHQISFYYPEGIIIRGNSTVNTFKVSGVVKRTPTTLVLGTGFQYLSSIYPSGATISSMFGSNNEAGIAEGFFGIAGADRIIVPEYPAASTFQTYYYELFDLNTFLESPHWADATTNSEIDPEMISFDNASGVVILNSSTVKAVTVSPPEFYNAL